MVCKGPLGINSGNLVLSTACCVCLPTPPNRHRHRLLTGFCGAICGWSPGESSPAFSFSRNGHQYSRHSQTNGADKKLNSLILSQFGFYNMWRASSLRATAHTLKQIFFTVGVRPGERHRELLFKIDANMAAYKKANYQISTQFLS